MEDTGFEGPWETISVLSCEVRDIEQSQSIDLSNLGKKLIRKTYIEAIETKLEELKNEKL